MSEVRTLYQIQTGDLEIDTLTQEMATVEAQLGETDELTGGRQALDDARETLQQQQAQMRSLEWQSDDLMAKIKASDAKLYGGGVRNPKELGNLQREAEGMKSSRSKVEDETLDLMAVLEETQALVGSRGDELGRSQADWEQHQRELAERQAQIAARLEELQKNREELAKSIPPSSLATYEDLRRNKRGRGVARIERNTCQGCHITLPMTIVQRARPGRELVFCPSCGRILYAER